MPCSRKASHPPQVPSRRALSLVHHAFSVVSSAVLLSTCLPVKNRETDRFSLKTDEGAQEHILRNLPWPGVKQASRMGSDPVNKA